MGNTWLQNLPLPLTGVSLDEHLPSLGLHFFVWKLEIIPSGSLASVCGADDS